MNLNKDMANICYQQNLKNIYFHSVFVRIHISLFFTKPIGSSLVILIFLAILSALIQIALYIFTGVFNQMDRDKIKSLFIITTD